MARARLKVRTGEEPSGKKQAGAKKAVKSAQVLHLNQLGRMGFFSLFLLGHLQTVSPHSKIGNRKKC